MATETKSRVVQQQLLDPQTAAARQVLFDAVFRGPESLIQTEIETPQYDQYIAGLTEDQRDAFDLARAGLGEYEGLLTGAGRALSDFETGLGQARQRFLDAETQARAGLSDASPLLAEAVQAGRAGFQAADPLMAEQLRVAREAQAGAQPLIQSGIGAFQEQAQMAREAGGMFDPSVVDSFMGQYEDAVVDRALDDIARQADRSRIGLDARAAQQGAFGGARQAIESNLIDETALREMGRTSAGLRAQGYGQALSQAQQAFEAAQQRGLAGASQIGQTGAQQIGAGTTQAGLANQLASIIGQQAVTSAGLGAQQAGILGQQAGQMQGMSSQLAQQIAATGAGLQGIGSQQAARAAALQGLAGTQQGMATADVNQLLGIGSIQQGEAQALLDAQLRTAEGQIAEPFKRFALASDILAGQKAGTNTATTTTGPEASRSSEAIGTGIALLGLGNRFNPFAREGQ